MKGYDFLKLGLSSELKPKTIIKTEHERQFADDWKEYDYYIFHADNMFHRCNEEGKLGSKYQDRYLNYKVLQKDFVVHYIPTEEEIEDNKKIEKLDLVLLGQCDNWIRKYNTEKKEFESLGEEINPYIIDTIRENAIAFQKKINEIIEVLNDKD